MDVVHLRDAEFNTMGRYIGPKNKIARRFGVNLGLKTNSSKVARRITQRPGVHGMKRAPKSTSVFGKQLIEKQKAKFMYGIRERQLHKIVQEATRLEGDSGLNLQRLLELRFDNLIYRLGFAVTRAQARQMVGHGMFTLNGKKMTIPSHVVKVGDVVEVKQNKTKKKIFDTITEQLSKANLPSWVSVNAAAKTGKVTSNPTTDDFDKIFDVTLIVEYYSSR